MLEAYPIPRRELEGIVDRCLGNARVRDDVTLARLRDFVSTAERVAFGVSYERPDCRCPLVGAYHVTALSAVPGWLEDDLDGPLHTFTGLFDMCGYARTGLTYGELVVTDA